MVRMIEHAPLATFHPFSADAASDAASVAAIEAASEAASPYRAGERIEVVLASDRRREHAPALRARLVAEMMAGPVMISELARREDICASVLHRWLRRARIEAGQPVPSAPVRSGPARMLPVRIAAPAPAGMVRQGAGLEVVLGNGRVLRVPAGVDPVLVAQMAAALEG